MNNLAFSLDYYKVLNEKKINNTFLYKFIRFLSSNGK